MSILKSYEGWEGDIFSLARAATQVLQGLGRGDIPPPNIRLIRDYAQRGILSPTFREGKLARYEFQHLKELVAARILVNEGVPLAKIAEQFEGDRDIVIVALGQAGAAGKPETGARSRWRQLDRLDAPSARPGDDEAPRAASAHFMRQAVLDSGRRLELAQTLQRLGQDPENVTPRQLTHLALTDWCTLVIDSDRLRSLSLEEAEDIGLAVTAALSDPRIKKGEKP